MTVLNALEEYLDDYTEVEVYADVSDSYTINAETLIRIDDKGGRDYLYADVQNSAVLSEEEYNKLFHPNGNDYTRFDNKEKVLVLIISNRHAPRYGRIVLDFDLCNAEEKEIYHNLKAILNL